MQAVASPPPPSAPRLNQEQLAAAHAPLHEATAVLAAAGTGKTTTMRERVTYMLDQGVEAEAILALTFSRKTQAEFADSLKAVPGAERVTVSTFHAWCWMLVRRHWREAGYEVQPTLLASEEQQMPLMRDTIVWDCLAEVQASMRSWLFLPPSASWEEVAAVVVERHAALYSRSLQLALEAHNASEQPGSWPALSLVAAAARPFLQLPPRLQMLLLLELHEGLRCRFGGSSSCSSDFAEGGGTREMLSSADQQAPYFLKWLEEEKRQGRLPDEAAYAAFCTSAITQPSGPSSGSVDARERHSRLMRVSAAYQAELRRLSLASLSDLPLLARRLLGGGGAALEWARSRWQHVLVDEFQDTGRVMLDLLKLLMGERRSITVVGDDDQSIYSFLCAMPNIFSNFQSHFGARVFCLQTNFRSTAAICSFGSALLHGNHGRAADKAMLPARNGPCQPVLVRQFASAAEEAKALAEEVHRLWRQEGVPLSSISALYRCLRLQGTAPHAPLVAALRRRGIPFVVVGHNRLAEDEGVCALISYLALVANPACDPGFETVLGQPYHGLGRDVRSALAQQRQAARLAGQAPPSLLQCAEQVCGQAAAAAAGPDAEVPAGIQLAEIVDQLNREDLEELHRLVRLLKRMRQAVGREPLPQAVRRVLHESGLVAWLQQQQQGVAAEGEAGMGGGQQGGAGAAEEEEEEELPPKLRSVLIKAQQLAAEWQGTQGGGSNGISSAATHHAAAAEGGWSGWEAGGTPGSSQQAEEGTGHGIELVKELLVRLATETSADSQQGQLGQRAQQGEEGSDGRDPGTLTISTIHAAKGLEWGVVILPQACDGTLPLQFRPSAAAANAAAWQAGSDDGSAAEGAAGFGTARRAHYEEERRLFHVAATRAKDRLLVSYVQPMAAMAEPGEHAMADATATQQQQLEKAAAVHGAQDPAQLPHCSSILAGTLRRLLHHLAGQAGQQLLVLEGRLPEHDFPHLWQPLATEDCGCPPQGGLAASGSQANSQAQQQLSLAERCRQRLASKGGAAGIKGAGVAKRAGVGRGRAVGKLQEWRPPG